MTYKTREEYLSGITGRLNNTQIRLGTIDRLVRKGQPIDAKIIENLEETYKLGLKHLKTLGAIEEHRTYDVWYQRRLNGGDPL